MPRYPKRITKLSELEIDADKDWATKKIENLGAPDSGDDAPRDDTIDSKITTHKGDASAHHTKTTDASEITSGRFGKNRLEWTADKLLKGAGVGADPTEIDGDNAFYGKVLVDLAANRPAAGIAGRWFIASDTLAISYDDGAAWTTVGTLGGQDVSDYATHKADASAHHAKTTDAGDITSGVFSTARIPNLDASKITSGRFGKTRLNWTANKLLKGAGAGSDPVEIDVPSGATTVYKIADEIVNNSGTLQNDDDLLFAIGANEVWGFTITIDFLSDVAPDLKVAITVPTDCKLRARLLNVDSATLEVTYLLASGGSSGRIDGRGTIDGTNNVIFSIVGFVVNGANAGNVQFQWAQQTAEASDTTVKKGSYLIAHKLA